MDADESLTTSLSKGCGGVPRHEEVYLKDYQDVQESITGLGGYVEFYNHERLHQSLAYRTPAAVYRHGKTMAAATTFN